VERFNGRINELLRQTRFDSRADLEVTLLNYLKLYNHHMALCRFQWNLTSGTMLANAFS
jgi:hypothetical protein